SPLPARSLSPLLRGVRTRLAPNNRCRDSAPATRNLPAPCASRTPHTSPPALLPQMRVQLLPTLHTRNRHHKVPPRVTHQPFHLPLVVALARTSELLFKQIVALQFQECPRLLPLSAPQHLR